MDEAEDDRVNFTEMPFPEHAEPDELPLICRLLAACELPYEDLKAEHLVNFLVLRLGSLVSDPETGKSKEQLLGVIGLEPFGRDGLLRSLAVASAYRGQCLGELLVSQLEASARQGGIERLFILTTTAPEFFRQLGYEVTQRDAAPEPIRQSTEFQSLCPASAVCLSKRL